ncbi:MAG: HEAT repeat domain-containing protein [Methanobrevibacter sp.]|jgi:HEAT repeat protein|nr:HEAT repeat domain-containing protein [Methanobrevibacter sp.]
MADEKFSITEAIAKLKDKDSEIRKKAIQSLEDIDDEKVIKAELDALCDENTLVRHKAAENLGKLGEKTVDLLIEKANHSKAEEKRFTSLAIKGTKSKKAIEYFLSNLDDEDWGVRKVSMRSLGELKATETIDKIVELMVDEKDWGVRLAAIRSLGDMEVEEAIAPLKKIRRNAKKIVEEDDVKDFKKAINKSIKQIEKAIK